MPEKQLKYILKHKKEKLYIVLSEDRQVTTTDNKFEASAFDYHQAESLRLALWRAAMHKPESNKDWAIEGGTKYEAIPVLR